MSHPSVTHSEERRVCDGGGGSGEHGAGGWGALA